MGALIEVYNNHELFGRDKKEVEELLIANASQVTKVSQLKKIINILIRQGDYSKAQEILSLQRDFYTQSYEITILRINIAKKLKKQALVTQLLDELYDQLVFLKALNTKQKLRFIQIFLSHQKYDNALQLLLKLKESEEYKNEVNTILNTNNSTAIRSTSLLKILPNLNPNKANAFIQEYKLT